MEMNKTLLCIIICLMMLSSCVQAPPKQEPAAGAPVYTPPPPPPDYIPFAQPKTIYISGTRVNIRTGPDTGAEIISCLPKGASLTGLGQKSNGWYHVRLKNGKEGYVHNDYVSFSRPAAPKPAPQIAKDDQSESASQPLSPGQPVPAPENAPPAAEQAKPAISPGKALIASAAPVKVRAQPSQLAKALEEVSPGAQITVIESQGSWCKIKTSQNTGFVPTNTITPGGN